MIIYGKNAVREAMLGGKTINKLMVENGQKDKQTLDILTLARRNKVKISYETAQNLTKRTGTPKHQGVVAEITDFVYSTPREIIERAEEKGELPFVLVLDEIADPHNLGAIIRTAESIGVHGIILQKRPRLRSQRHCL